MAMWPMENYRSNERRYEMDNNMMKRNRLWYTAAALVLVLGCLVATILAISTLSSYPSFIKEAYDSPLQKIEIPGETVIQLRQKGAYGLYYESAHVPAGGPPELACNLVSITTGDDIPLVPDYVPTNRYENKDGRVGVLIYSTTINHPGLHRLSCSHPDGSESPTQVLAIGPNYIFEFLRVAWKMGRTFLGIGGVLFCSVVFSIGITAVALFQSRKKRQLEGGKDD
jgi:hypothetical protein